MDGEGDLVINRIEVRDNKKKEELGLVILSKGIYEQSTTMNMTAENLNDKLSNLIRPTYPDIDIKVFDQSDGKRHIYFTDERFSVLYPQQRYHYLLNLIPKDFFDNHLIDTIWHELAPGENPDNLDYHDLETIESIKGIILEILKNKTDFVNQLDNLFLSQKAVCFGDFRHSKKILTELNFSMEEQFDIFHVLMQEGGFCDCEILYNTFKESEYAKKYWTDGNK